MLQPIYDLLDTHLPEGARMPFDTSFGAFAALVVTLGLYHLLKRFVFKPRANDAIDSPIDEPANESVREHRPVLGPLCAWLGLVLGVLIADHLIAPRSASTDLDWPIDAAQRSAHVFGAGAIASLLAFLPARVLPPIVSFLWRALLGAGVGLFAVWAMGYFLVENEIWTTTRFWTVGAVTAVTTGALFAIVGQTTERTGAPVVTSLTSSALLGAASAPIFSSKSTTMAHTLGASAIAFFLIALVTIRWRDLGRSSIVPMLALSALIPAIVVPAVYAETMLVATLIPLALAPLALTLHRLPSIERVPGPAWLFPALAQLIALLALVGCAGAFAIGLLQVHPDNAPWASEDAPATPSPTTDDYFAPQ